MSRLLSKADHDIQTAILAELAWIPELPPGSGVRVDVDNGAVTLHGRVDRNVDRIAARRAASRVRGVRTVVDDLEVAHSVWDHSEAEVAEAVRHALRWASDVPAGIESASKDGVVVLTGEVRFDHERRAAQRAVERIQGVEGVDNRIELLRRPSAADASERIQHALVRNAIVDARGIHVQAEGTTIILKGRVRTWLEKVQASRTAWASPHVTEVDNRLIVEGD
jgi:osmotically-inducible protein OsmY